MRLWQNPHNSAQRRSFGILDAHIAITKSSKALIQVPLENAADGSRLKGLRLVYNGVDR
jgi:hypothetical protein